MKTIGGVCVMRAMRCGLAPALFSGQVTTDVPNTLLDSRQNLLVTDLAEKKNQHFVPKVYMKAFASDEGARRINIWLQKHDRTVMDASIKDQCSKSYFYGKDLVVENLFIFPEGLYGKTKDKLISGERANNDDLTILLLFWLIQHTRSERAIATHVLAMHLMREKILLGNEDDQKILEYLGAPMTEEDMAKMSLASAREYFETISDLKMVMLYNNSNLPFVTSDNPAVSSNRFLIQRFNGVENWGIGSAGFYVYLPISPSIAFFAYDINVYELSRRDRAECQINRKDVERLNQLVFLHCDNCIYFNDADSIERLLPSLRMIRDLKSDDLIRVNTAVLDEDDPSTGYQRFRAANDDEFADAKQGLLHLESRPPMIKDHFPKLRYKQNKRFIDTKSAAGLVRYKPKKK